MRLNVIPGDHALEWLARLCSTLSDQTRLKILVRLTEGACDVATLVNHLALPQPTVSQHLGSLRRNNLVTTARRGRQVVYDLAGNACRRDHLCLCVGRYSVKVHQPDIDAWIAN